MNKSLFSTRLRKEIGYQWGVFKSVVDWTIFLYLFIPAIAIGVYHYYFWWSDIPNWITGFPLSLIFILLYFFCWEGRIRTFLEEADQLFLLQKRYLVVVLKKSTRNLFVLGYSIEVFILVGILAPFLFNYYNLSWLEILSVTFYFISLKALILGWKQNLDDIVSPWKKGFITVSLFIVLGAITSVIVAWAVEQFALLLVMIGLIQWFLFWKTSSKRIDKLTTFSKDVELEKMLKLKYVRSIFVFSEYVEKTPNQKKRSPYFYRNSKRIYKKRNRNKSLQELFIKAFFRNKTYLFQCLQISSITTAALFVIPPIWIKCIIFFGYIIIVRMWIKIVYKRILSNHFIVNVRKDDIIRIQAEHYIVNLISLPVISIVGLILILIIV
ncbi:ABC transporter permease [Fredinandcohnia onubensis]|uniref:ABC transporter permease n=1 Tax=Fredinandcohnia onubensis TaxID=1571209 RepID=UPI000C0C03B9|nr:ABC transporter permease [Fredinandcohnia onubensis]